MSKPRVAVAHYTYPEDIGGVTSWVVPLLEHLVNQPIELAVHLHVVKAAYRLPGRFLQTLNFDVNLLNCGVQLVHVEG